MRALIFGESEAHRDSFRVGDGALLLLTSSWSSSASEKNKGGDVANDDGPTTARGTKALTNEARSSVRDSISGILCMMVIKMMEAMSLTLCR